LFNFFIMIFIMFCLIIHTFQIVFDIRAFLWKYMCLFEIFSEINFLLGTIYFDEVSLIKTPSFGWVGVVKESANHLFLDCKFFGSIWQHVQRLFDFSSVDPSSVSDHFMSFCFFYLDVLKYDDLYVCYLIFLCLDNLKRL